MLKGLNPALVASLLLLNATPACRHRDASTIRQIAIQPIYPFDSSRLPQLKYDLVHFFRRPVVLLTPIHIPQAYINNKKGERYSADSIVDALTKMTTDSITQVVGFTGMDIFTAKNRYDVWGIFGLHAPAGHRSLATIASGRLTTTNSAIASEPSCSMKSATIWDLRIVPILTAL